MKRTKIAGYLIIAIAVLNTAVDALNGGGFDLTLHINDLILALGGAGFVFLRDAIEKIK
jgi:hypothetical protein